jgi:hypothetical protein
MDTWHLDAGQILWVDEFITKEVIDLAELKFVIESEFFIGFTL